MVGEKPLWCRQGNGGLLFGYKDSHIEENIYRVRVTEARQSAFPEMAGMRPVLTVRSLILWGRGAMSTRRADPAFLGDGSMVRDK